MIVYANSRVIGTSPDGDAKFVKSIGENQDTLSVTDETIIRYLFSILKQLKIMNIHLQTMTDQKISDADVVQEIE